MKNIVVIPIYKIKLSKKEEISFIQCLRIFNSHIVYVVTYKDLDISKYEEISAVCGVHLLRENFDQYFFYSIAGYNKLMLSADFYKRFSQYDYMLIYQLDAYVFRDELDYWCDKGYDYIGAPWFENFGSHENGEDLWKVGNGGFSLRRVSSMMRYLSQCHVRDVDYLQQKYKNCNSWITFLCIMKYWRLKNFMSYYLLKYKGNEDGLFSIVSQTSPYKLKVPNVNVAVSFAFEKSPQYLFELNNNQLPFGCHAWYKYDYESFWSRYIPRDIDELYNS